MICLVVKKCQKLSTPLLRVFPISHLPSFELPSSRPPLSITILPKLLVTHLFFFLLFFFLRVSVKIVSNGLLEFAEKAEKFIAEAASDGAQLVVFPEAFIAGYPRGYRFGIGVGVHNEAGRDCFRRYHASAIVVPGKGS